MANFSIKKTASEISPNFIYPHYIEGEVYSPLIVDTDFESMTQHDVDYLMLSFTGKLDQIDVSHNNQICGARAVRMFKALPNDPDGYSVGAWVLGCGLNEGEVWESIKTGELNGYSAEFISMKVPKTVVIDMARIALGVTEANINKEILPEHSHEYYIEFNEKGQVALATTSEVLGHTHSIIGTVTTEKTMEHTHRFFVD